MGRLAGGRYPRSDAMRGERSARAPGISMTAQLRALRPAIEVVRMTGDALAGAGLLRRPFRAADLLAIVSVRLA